MKARAGYVGCPAMQQEILVCGWLCSASSTLRNLQCSKFGKVVFCEMALCPGMQWVKVSSEQRDLCFVPLAGTHYMASECCFSCGFPSLSWFQAVLKHRGRKEQASSQRKGESPESPVNAGPYLCYCTVFTPPLAFICSQEKIGDVPFSQQIQKNPTSRIKT